MSGGVRGSVWLDGSLLPAGEAEVSVFDHGLTVGDGVFETLKVVRGVPFAARRHLARLRRSAAGLGLEVPLSDDDLREAMAQVVASDSGIGRIRLTITGGLGPPGSGRGGATPTVVVGGATLEPWPPTAQVVTVPWPRNERSPIAGLKTTSYAENVVALARAQEQGASEAIFPNTVGNLCEGTGSNVFVVVDGALGTPPLAAGCLAGVTRELVLEVVDGAEVDIPMSLVESGEVREAFLTSSTRDVQPIDRWDQAALTGGQVTADAVAAFAALVSRDLDP